MEKLIFQAWRLRFARKSAFSRVCRHRLPATENHRPGLLYKEEGI
jgi:hypothetical protein